MNHIDLRKIDLNLLVVFDTLMREGSVSRTAERLGRTQSAASHALARLREQLGDPLLVKVGGRMQASPYAMDLIQEVRPILRGIERALGPRETFQPATSTRRFRLSVPDLTLNLFPHLMQRLHREAPHIVVEWETPRANTSLDVAEGLVDLALLPDEIKRPDGVAAQIVGQFQWACFMRAGHPALRRWTARQWSAWSHIVVGTSDGVRSPVSAAAAQEGLTRTTGVVAPTFGAVAPLLAQSDMIATLPAIVLADALDRFQLKARPVPFAVPDMTHVMAWSARTANEPAGRWLRACFADVFAARLADAHKHVGPARAR